ncbi:MAG: rhodanese-related sulfurtransferase [Psychroserpens sp.]|jgi:rhodanese-related sulfurtransferase
MLNKTGYDTFESVLKTGNIALSSQDFEDMANHEDALVLDVRPQSDFIKSHIPNSIFIGLNGSFAPWVGALIKDIKQPIILVVPEGKSQEAVTRLSRVGYDNTLGYLEGGIDAWISAGKDIDTLESISAKEFANRVKDGDLNILDVRKDGEYTNSHLEDAQHFALDFINGHMNEVSKDNTYHIHCAGGYRSVIAASILKARGFHNLVDVAGGFDAIKTTDLPTTDFICPSTL